MQALGRRRHWGDAGICLYESRNFRAYVSRRTSTDGETGTCAQVESKCEVRRALPMPKPGALPLPPSMDPARLRFLPDRIEDLNVLLPEGIPQLETPPAHPKAGNTSMPRPSSFPKLPTGADFIVEGFC